MIPVLDIQALTVDFDSGGTRVRALHGIDLTLGANEALGIVGESGCGKTITWLAMLGLLDKRARVGGSARLAGLERAGAEAGPPKRAGTELVGASDAALSPIRGGRIAMIFQDPSSALNPLHRIGWQLAEALRLHRGLTGAAARTEMLRLLDRVGIADARRRLDDYPHEMSGGMNQRVMIAMALAGEPEILVADEPTTALDVTTQAQILDLIAEIRAEDGMALVLISHDLGVVAELADRVAVMYAGRIVELAPTERLFAAPAHPYSAGLLGALPVLDGPRRRLTAIPGTVPPPDRLPPGCSFAPRCAHAGADCGRAIPALRGTVHRVACLRSLAPPEPVARVAAYAESGA